MYWLLDNPIFATFALICLVGAVLVFACLIELAGRVCERLDR